MPTALDYRPLLPGEWYPQAAGSSRQDVCWGRGGGRAGTHRVRAGSVEQEAKAGPTAAIPAGGGS